MFSKVESVEMECWQRPLLREQVEVHQGGVPTTDAYFDLAVPGGSAPRLLNVPRLFTDIDSGKATGLLRRTGLIQPFSATQPDHEVYGRLFVAPNHPLLVTLPFGFDLVSSDRLRSTEVSVGPREDPTTLIWRVETVADRFAITDLSVCIAPTNPESFASSWH